MISGIMSKLFLESLDKNRLRVFEELRSFRDIGVLGGGTALALQIGHRISFDFDIFILQKPDSALWKKAKHIFGEKSEKRLDSEYQLNLTTPESVAVTFFCDDYKNMFTPIKTEVIDLMDIRDIAANKAYVLGKRPKWRDYADIYFLLKGKHIVLDEIVRLANRKFATDFSERLFLEQLVYWQDVENYTVEFVGGDIAPDTIKSFLEDEVRKYAKTISTTT